MKKYIVSAFSTFLFLSSLSFADELNLYPTEESDHRVIHLSSCKTSKMGNSLKSILFNPMKLFAIMASFGSQNHFAHAQSSQYCPAGQSCLATNRAGLDYSLEQDPNQNLIKGLSYILGVDITGDGESLHFHGTPTQLKSVRSYFDNSTAIRGDFIPSSPDHKKINSHRDPCLKLQEYFQTLALRHQDFSNFNIGDITASSDKILLPYESRSNQRAAALFEDIAAEASPFIPWAIENVEGFRTNDNHFVRYSFRKLDGYLCGLDNHLAPKETDYSSGSIKLPAEWILKHLIAATSGEVSLRKTDREGVFTVVTTSSSEKISSNSFSEIKAIVDASRSMSGNPITQVNQWLPMVYEEIGKIVKYPVNVRLWSFSDDLKSEYNFTIHPMSGSSNNYTHIGSLRPYTFGFSLFPSILKFPDITVRGGTDLSYIGNMITSNEGGVVIAFSDGEHASSTSLLDHYHILEQNKGSNRFAYPVTCTVGSGIDTSYFEKVQSIFGGKTFSASDVLSFFGEIRSAAKDILSPRVSLILTLNGVDVTDWVLDKAGIQNVGKVSRGDKVVLNGIEYEIDPEV